MSWEAGRSALDFTLVLFNGAVQIKLRNTLYLCYSGYVKPYSGFPEGLEKASRVGLNPRPAEGEPKHEVCVMTRHTSRDGASETGSPISSPGTQPDSHRFTIQPPFRPGERDRASVPLWLDTPHVPSFARRAGLPAGGQAGATSRAF
ncbi:hypothetical protein D9C73_024692 [Collichthys lucidus]|uniref:Uncharacterized protein n=1 Tax=Collichthys lucidus TaxID=240159 RepID=A0A4U5VQ92_COLLU|nr:hypothetical protein D9C73_024692 [Collichthys lucidus]